MQNSFESLDTLLHALGTTRKVYFGFIRHNRANLYSSFELQSKRGKTRRIEVPHPFIKQLQKKLVQLIEPEYRVPAPCHGFVKGKSIVTNARFHTKKKVVLNIDLKDFFPTVTRMRIQSLLCSSRYKMPKEVAKFIAHLVTFEGRLPQGAPTSPLISNMICARLDSRMRLLAKESKAQYTRYADDISFSTSLPTLSGQILEEENPLRLSKSLQNIILSEGFELNSEKSRLSKANSEQIVTGLKVNRFPNVSRKRVNDVRAMLWNWEQQGEIECNKDFHRRKGLVHISQFRFRDYVRGQIAFIGGVRGTADPVTTNLVNRFRFLTEPEFAITAEQKLKRALEFLQSVEDESDAQVAGYRLETAMKVIADAFGIPAKLSFRLEEGAIQVDGQMHVNSHEYWLECKWTKEKVSSTIIQTVIGKISFAHPGMRGIVISKSGFTEESLTVACGSKKILLVEYKELKSILESGKNLGAEIETKWLALPTS
jgi:RNA-directed DNA polymerase